MQTHKDYITRIIYSVHNIYTQNRTTKTFIKNYDLTTRYYLR